MCYIVVKAEQDVAVGRICHTAGDRDSHCGVKNGNTLK